MPVACTIGHKDLVHCSLPVRAIGFPKVLVNGIPWSVLGDINIPHLMPAGPTCVVHVAPIAIGVPKVLINGRPGGVLGSKLATCTAVAMGFPKVIAGW